MKPLLQHHALRIIALGAALSIAVVIAFAPSTWPTMMVRSFLPQWIMAFVVIACWLLVKKRWREGALTSCCALVLWPQLPDAADAVTGHGPMLRAAHFNVLQSNEAYADAIRTMLLTDADVISVQEVDPEWAAALIEGLSPSYPYQVIEPHTNCYGIALFSRVPLIEAHVIRLGASPAIEALLEIGARRVHVIAAHTSSPGSPGHFSARNRQFELLRDRVRASLDPVIVIGDLNAAPWDKDLQRLLASTGLRTHAVASDPTFPSGLPMALIPIDHVLAPEGFSVVQHSVHVPGSDHRGLVAEIRSPR